jgi:DNA-binding SARP family transcriptional activator
MSQLQLSLLGTPIIKHGEHTLTFSTRKALALLAYLAVEGGMHTRKALSEAFWPELDAEHGRAALRATLLELRKLLERAHGPDEQPHLLVERDLLAFDQSSPLLLDLHLVEIASKQTAEARVHECNTLVKGQFEQAICLARGPFLAGFTLRDSQFFDDWARQQREYWHLRTQHLFESVSLLYEQAGEREQAIDVVTHWLRFDPLSEEGYRRQMRLRFALGDRVGALRTYATCRAVLADELQIEPEPETMALAKHLRHTTPFHPSPSRPPYPSTRQEPPHLLDGPLIGRSTEFGTLIDRYQRVHTGQPQLVLLQGESGIGKTRLANEFVRWAQAQGANVLAGRVLQTERQLPYQPFIDILRHRLGQEQTPQEPISAVWLTELARLLPELHERFPNLPVSATDEELGHHHLFEAITRIVRRWAAHHPLILLLDDMQWADTGTLDLLLYLARSLAEQPASVLLLLNIHTGTTLQNLQTTWAQALKRTHIPLTTQTLVAFSKEETHQFVHALAWAEQPLTGKNSGRLNEQYLAASELSSTCREKQMYFANWLYVQTQGQPFYLVELLKELLEREIILPSPQEKGRWGLLLKRELLTETPTGELIPGSVRELIGSQLSQLTPPARAFLVAAAVLERDLTFERLCSVAQVDELTGLQALEDLIQSGLLCEGRRVEEVRALDGYRFPGEMMREVVCQEAGTTRQRLMQQRVRLMLREELDPGEEDLPDPTPLDRQVPTNIRHGQGGQAVLANTSKRGKQQNGAKDHSEVIRTFAGNRPRRTKLAGGAKRDAAERGIVAIPRSPPVIRNRNGV